MKRAFLLTYSLLLCFLTSMAQHKVIISLTDGTTIEKDVWEVESITFGDSDPISIIEPADTTEAVDLGLSVKWANANIQFEEGKSLLIGWGDVSGKVQSTDMAYYPMLDYYDNIVNGEYDMARALWGDGWRLPSEKEVRELIDSCDWTAVYSEQDNSFLGYNVTGPSGESIFMPVTGKRTGTETGDVLSGYYWTGIISSNPQKARYLTFAATQTEGTDDAEATENGNEDPAQKSTESVASVSDDYRYIGFAVRPVYGQYKVGVTVGVNYAFNILPKTAMITATFDGDIQDIVEFGLRYSDSYDAVAKGTGVNKISLDGSKLSERIYTFELNGLDYGKTYYYQAYANVENADSVSDIKSFMAASKYAVEWVDLGLSSGLLWASYNLSATNTLEKGNYFAWADPDEVSKNQSTYPWLVESSPADIAFTEYDVVHKVLGGEAHLPNTYDFFELKKECTWIYEPGNEVTPKGWYVEGPNGKRIFFPLAGNRQADGSSYYDGSIAYLWTSENFDGLKAKSYTFSTSAGTNGRVENVFKYFGMSIRPVQGKSNTFDPYDPPKEENPSDYDKYAVDLGLSVDWSSVNIGATSAEQQGDLYAWGEINTKETYTQDNYQYYIDGQYQVLNDSYDIAASDYDVAHVKWAGDWVMPNQIQWNELIENCDWTWTSQNGVQGYKITSKINGNSIFLSAHSYDQGTYWSSIMCFRDGAYKINSSYYILIKESVKTTSCIPDYRFYGRMVRPVKIKR